MRTKKRTGHTPWEATVSRDLLVGKQLGDYVVERRIGAGGMGIVYEGEQRVIGKQVAIKMLRPEFADDEQLQRLLAEARAVNAIGHRGIIDIFGFGELPDGRQYMVMEYLEGTPLDDGSSTSAAPLPPIEVLALLDEVLARARRRARRGRHSPRPQAGQHLPRAAAATARESVKLLDFGLAKRATAPDGTHARRRAPA